jgi:hypothetical protein
MIKHIFLDLDDVLADFKGGLLACHGRQDLRDKWPPGVWDLATVLGISNAEVWGKIDREGAAFWERLVPLPWLAELVALVRGIAPFTVLSSPPLSPDSAAGKIRWMNQHLGNGQPFRDYMLTPAKNKRFLARPDYLLIDDSDRNVQEWMDTGGTAILFPARQNTLHIYVHNPMPFVLGALSVFDSQGVGV